MTVKLSKLYKSLETNNNNKLILFIISAAEAYNDIRNAHGAANCFLLKMNSRPPGPSQDHFPNPWSQFITNRIDTNQKPDNSPNSARLNLEVGQEANEIKSTVDYHPLSPDNEDISMV